METGTGERLYLYPLWLRIWHGINALCIIALIISGVSLHYADRSILLLDFQTAITVHNFAGVIVSISYLLFVFGNLLTKNGKYYRVKVQGLSKRIQKQISYYTHGMFKGEQPPFPVSLKRKFNPLQKYAYIFVMYVFLPVLIVTGFALFFPEIIFEQIFQVSGIMITAVLHGIMGFFVFLFLLIHLYVASMGKSPAQNYKSIITGWHT
jgi:thiosulfate reductase cytochrome b subunit